MNVSHIIDNNAIYMKNINTVTYSSLFETLMEDLSIFVTMFHQLKFGNLLNIRKITCLNLAAASTLA